MIGATLEEYYKYYLPQARACIQGANPDASPNEIEEEAIVLAMEWADDDYERFVDLPDPQ